MIVSLDILYRSQFYLLPMRAPEGHLYGIELMTNFVGIDAPVRIPTELIFPHITAEQELSLFEEQLSFLETQQQCLNAAQLVSWLNISEIIVDAILSQPELITRISRLSFLSFTINETFADINRGRGNNRLRKLGQLFPLILANFGAGIATTKPIFDGLFSGVMLDKTFVQKQIHADSFAPFMQAILAQLSPFCRAMLIAGIDDEAARSKACSLGFTAMQGNLWPVVAGDSLAGLIASA